MASSEVVLNVRAELDNAVVVRPGDKLVFGTPNRLSQQDADTIKQMLAAKLPGVETVIISECSGLAVYRPDDRVVRKIGYALTDDEYDAMKAQGIIDADGKTTVDRIMEQLPNEIHRERI